MQNRFNSENKRLPPSGRVSRKEKEKIHSNWAVNDVSIAIWAKARSLDVLEKKELAMKAYSQCIFLTHGRAWDPNGWFWSPSADCAKKAKKYLKKIYIISLYTIVHIICLYMHNITIKFRGNL